VACGAWFLRPGSLNNAVGVREHERPAYRGSESPAAARINAQCRRRGVGPQAAGAQHGFMCDGGGSPTAVAATLPRPAAGTAVDPIALEPVDEVVITTLVDNSYDTLMGDTGPARRAPLPGVAALEIGIGADQYRLAHQDRE